MQFTSITANVKFIKTCTVKSLGSLFVTSSTRSRIVRKYYIAQNFDYNSLLKPQSALTIILFINEN